MKRTGITLVIVLGVLSMAVLGAGAMWGTDKILEGTIKDVGANILIITQQAEEGNQLTEVAVEVTADTQYEEVASFEALKAGDQIKVEYTEEEQRKIATVISRVEETAGEEQPSES